MGDGQQGLLEQKFQSMKEGNVLFNDILNTFTNSERKEGNVLFNDTLNTFYLQLYGSIIW